MKYPPANRGTTRMYININKRIQWLDILRGLATVLVVIGHSETGRLSEYIYWFHMPLFFVLSGFFFKTLKNNNEMQSFIWKRTHLLLTPYLIYLTIIFLFGQLPILVIQHTDFIHICKSILIAYIIGGRALSGLFGVYWFFTCLLIAQIVFAFIHTYIKQRKNQLLIIFILYFFAHVEANYIKAGLMSISIPWNADVSMFALIFYAFGFFAKDFLDLRKSKSIKILSISINMNNLCVIASILSVMFIVLNIVGMIDYNLDLKHVVYNSLLLDFIIPTTFILSTFFVTQLNLPDSLKTALASIGNNSLPIIFLHIPIRYAIDIVNKLFVHLNSELSVIYIILGIVLPFYLNTLIFGKINFLLLNDNTT